MILVFRKEKKEKILNCLVSLYVYFVIYKKRGEIIGVYIILFMRFVGV